MPEMIPERLPSRASKGEERVFDILKQLPDDCIVYYEPVIRDRYPDFVVIIPDLGLLVIEAKGWRSGQLVGANTDEVTVVVDGRKEIQAHPSRQARGYMYGLMDVARLHKESSLLLHDNGDKQGKFIFPFAHLAVMNNLTRDQLGGTPAGDLRSIFPGHRVWMRNDLIELESADSDTIRERFKQAFDPWWPFGKLTPGQINVLRSVIHPEIVIAPPPSNAELATQPVTADLKVLDMRQERNARSIGDGHRVIYGVAGSGKTVLLIARAKLIAEDNSKQVLVLCFNKALAFYFQRVFKNTPNIRAQHFHAWGDRQSVRFVKDEDVADFGGRLLERLKRGEGDAGCYDAVLIDEVQDFDLTWLACAKLALKEPEDGDLMVVGDGDQSLYERRPFTWKDAGIAAIGRTTILRKNYRNTRQVLLCAQPFTSPTSTTYHGRGATNFAVAVNPAAAVRTGPWPEILAADSIYAECDIVVKHVRDWLTQGYTSSDGRRIKLQPTDITILYPYMPRQREQAMEYLLSKLRELTKTSWLKALGNDPARIPPGNLIVRTILSFKGLQNTAVIVMWSDLLPHWNDVDLDRGQFYVALTRAEDVLLVTRSGESEFTRQIESALAEARRGEA